MARTNKTQCPHCNSAAKTLTTRQITPIYREITFQCTNDECQFIFVGALAPIKQLQASLKPNPEINIPQFAS